jgi:hypothetical protein
VIARRALALAVAAALPLAGAAEIALHLHHARRAPPFEAYAALVGPIDELRRADERILVAPRWAEPLVRRALGDARMPLAAVARPDEDDHDAALEISILGERAPELDGWRESERRTVGPFALRRLERPAPAPPVRLDFVAALDPARVRVAMGEPPSECPFHAHARVVAGGLGGHPTRPARRFECGGNPFFGAGVTVVSDQGFRPRRCIWAHPPERGELVLDYERVDLGDRIVGHGGIDWITERGRKGAPVTLRVEIDGSEIGRVVHRDGDGWARFEIPVGAHAGRPAARVRFAIGTPQYLHRHFCFEARMR